MPRREKAVKVTISLPAELYETIEQKRQAIGETRSEYVVRSIEELLREQQEAEWDEQYRRAYDEQPETEEELSFLRAGLEAWAGANPYEE
jgi:metal-responsive CopG/Arc/MetJ family transcriptional regulator